MKDTVAERARRFDARSDAHCRELGVSMFELRALPIIAAVATGSTALFTGSASAEEWHNFQSACVVWRNQPPEDGEDSVIETSSCIFELPERLQGYFGEASIHSSASDPAVNSVWVSLPSSWDTLFWSGELEQLKPQAHVVLYCGESSDVEPETVGWIPLSPDYEPGSGFSSPSFSCSDPERPVLMFADISTTIWW